MKRILFVCYGNICRSPMAELIMKDLTKKNGLSEKIYIESAGTSSIEAGHPVYGKVREILESDGIDCSGKTARCIKREDYDRFDMIIAMDNENVDNLLRIFGSDPEGKISLLLDYTNSPGEIDDPYFTRNFTEAYENIKKGCSGILDVL